MKKLAIALFLLCILPGVVSAQDRATEIRNKLLNRDQSTVLVVAHRGDWRYAPENSIPAIENAIRMGVDIVEIDVARTKDGHFILMHDSKIDRTTTGKGLVSEWTLDSIKTLKLRNGCNIRTKEVVPTLEEALLYAKGKIGLNLDRCDKYFDEIYPILVKTGTTRQVIMKGSKPANEVMEQFGKYLEDVIYMPVVNLDRENAEEQIELFIRDLNPVAFELIYENDSNPLPRTMKDRLNGKSLIWYNTLWDTLAGGHDDDMALDDPDKGFGYLIDSLGARILQTDRPAYLIDYLQKKGLRD